MQHQTAWDERYGIGQTGLLGPTFHPEEGKESDWPGEAKIAGRAIPAGPVTTDQAGEMFVADITEVVITGLNIEATKLVVESWTLERGLRRVEHDERTAPCPTAGKVASMTGTCRAPLDEPTCCT